MKAGPGSQILHGIRKIWCQTWTSLHRKPYTAYLGQFLSRRSRRHRLARLACRQQWPMGCTRCRPERGNLGWELVDNGLRDEQWPQTLPAWWLCCLHCPLPDVVPVSARCQLTIVCRQCSDLRWSRSGSCCSSTWKGADSTARWLIPKEMCDVIVLAVAAHIETPSQYYDASTSEI